MEPIEPNLEVRKNLFHSARLISVEGGDGAGKTTFMNAFLSELQKHVAGIVLADKEPATQIIRRDYARFRKGRVEGEARKLGSVSAISALCEVRAEKSKVYQGWADLSDVMGQNMFVLDRCWWTTIAYQYLVLGETVDDAIKDYLDAQSNFGEGDVWLPGIVIRITDGHAGALALDRLRARGPLDPNLEDGGLGVFAGREARYNQLEKHPLAAMHVINVVNDFDSAEDWERQAEIAANACVEEIMEFIESRDGNYEERITG